MANQRNLRTIKPEERALASIELVADYRMADRRKVDPDLVSAASFGVSVEQCKHSVSFVNIRVS